MDVRPGSQVQTAGMRRPAPWRRGLVALCWVLGSGLRAAPNLAPNSSFEDGLVGWALWHEPDAVAAVQALADSPRHGAACVRVTAATGEAVLYSEPIPVHGGADYTLSAYVRTRASRGSCLALWVAGGALPTALAWAPASAAGMSAPGLLANPGFEAGEGGWQLWRGAPDESSGGVADGGRNGSHAFHVLNPGTQGANLHSDPVPCEPGAVYTLSVCAKVRAGQRVGISVWARDATGKTLSYAVERTLELPAEVPEFRRFAITVTAPPDSRQLKAHLVCNGGEVWWDDAHLVRLAAAAGYEQRAYLELPVDQPAWARIKHIVRTPPGCTWARVLLVAGPGEVAWDAVQLESGRDTTPYAHVLPPQCANLLPNSGFDDGDRGWTLWRQDPGQSSGGVEPGSGRRNSPAFHVRNPGPGGANLYSDAVPCQPGATMTVSAWARLQGGREVHLAAWALDGEGKTLSYGVDGPVGLPGDVPEYQRFEKTFIVPERATGIRAHLVCNGGEVWWEDVQVESGPGATAYGPGPRYERLEPGFDAATVDYTRAIIREARLRDVLAQGERLVGYAPPERRAEAQEWLQAARDAVAAVTTAVGASWLVPEYRTTDFAAVSRRADAAQARLEALWRGLGHDFGHACEPWDPEPLPANADATRLAREFLIFPCFTRPLFFRGTGNWEVLAPFRFRLVSGWWGIGCDAQGALRSGELEAVLAECRAHGYPCDISLDPAQAAAVALDGREELYLHNAEGGWSPQGNCHNTVSIWHPEVRRLGPQFAERVAARFAANPAVLSYEMTNEPSLTIEQHEHGYEYRPAGVGGYEAPAVAAWQAWLMARYGSLEELNRRWRTACRGVADITPPPDLAPPVPVAGGTAVPCGALHDFQLFRAVSHAEWFRLCLEGFRRGDPRKAVISQFYSPPIERKDAAVDLRMLAEDAPWSMYGTHDWPGDRPAVESLYATAMNRRAQRPHWEDEFIWSQWERKGTPEPVLRAALERNLWRQVAWGKRAVSLFNLESEWAHDSPQNWNNSLLNLEADLEVPRYCTGILPTIERKINGIKEILYSTELGPADVAILRPSASARVAAPEGRVRGEGRAVAEALLLRHWLPALVPEEHLAADVAALAGVRLLIAPWAVHVPVDVQTQILGWVRAGGVLVCSGPFGLFDEYGLPAGLVLRASLGDLDWSYDAAKASWRALPVATADAAWRAAPCGSGRVCVSEEPFAAPGRIEALAALQRSLIPVPLVETDVADLEILPRQTAAGELLLCIINLNAREEREGEVRLRGRFVKAVELSCECRPAVPLTHDGKTMRCRVHLAPGTAVLLQLEAQRE